MKNLPIILTTTGSEYFWTDTWSMAILPESSQVLKTLKSEFLMGFWKNSTNIEIVISWAIIPRNMDHAMWKTIAENGEFISVCSHICLWRDVK